MSKTALNLGTAALPMGCPAAERVDETIQNSGPKSRPFLDPKLASDPCSSPVGLELGLATCSVALMPGPNKCNSTYGCFVLLDTQLLDQIWVQIADPILGRSATDLVHILDPNLGQYVKESSVELTAACTTS